MLMTRTLPGALLLAGTLSVHAAGIDLDLGLCDKTPNLNADAPPHSPVAKAKKAGAAKAAVNASAYAPAKTARALPEAAAPVSPQRPPAR